MLGSSKEMLFWAGKNLQALNNLPSQLLQLFLGDFEAPNDGAVKDLYQIGSNL